MGSLESQVWRENRYVANAQQLEAFLWNQWKLMLKLGFILDGC